MFGLHTFPVSSAKAVCRSCGPRRVAADRPLEPMVIAGTVTYGGYFAFNGPPLVHNIYNSGHHADASFHFAVRAGARQHHWRFGDMPPQEQVTDDEVPAIIAYVRELQQANGIPYRPVSR